MSNSTELNFPSLTMLPLLSHAIAGALDASQEQLENLLQAENKPHVLDDAIVNRVIKSFRDQLKTIVHEKAICTHWKKNEKLTKEQVKIINEMEANIIEMEKINQKILFLAEHYKNHTIDKILEMDEGDLALSYLQGKLYPLIESLQKQNKANHRKSFTLPPDVTCQYHIIGNKGKRYTFRHAEWGEIGRIDVLPHGNQSQITSYAVAGDPRDPLTELRNALFRTIAIEVSRALEEKHGAGTTAELPPFDVKSDAKVVASKIMVCLTCDAPVAFLIFANDARTPDRLEDYARMMYTKILELNLPTWVIGAEEELIPGKEGIALILQILPERRKAEKISSLIFEPMLHKMQSGHCD